MCWQEMSCRSCLHTECRSTLIVIPLTLYRALRNLNPSPYLYFLDMGDFQIIGSSPEILVRFEEGEVTVRPIAGTRRRGKTPEEDEALAADLLADPKEIAEHLMLIDLGRNDVGQIAQSGSLFRSQKKWSSSVIRTSCISSLTSRARREKGQRYGCTEGQLAGGNVERRTQGACYGNH